MNSVTMTTIAVVIWFFVLIIIANLLKKYLQQRDVDWNQFYVLAIFAAFSVITIIMIIYATSPTIDLFTRGGTAEFGQFGDMIGGLLNPIFGFITVLLLLHGAQIQRHDMRREKNLRDIESLYSLLDKAKTKFEKSIHENNFLAEDEASAYSFISLYTPSKNYSSDSKNTIEKILAEVKMESSMSNLSKKTNFEYKHYTIFNIRSEYISVIKHYEKLLELEDFEYAQADIANQLLNFFLQTKTLALTTEAEDSEIAKLIESHRHKSR